MQCYVSLWRLAPSVIRLLASLDGRRRNFIVQEYVVLEANALPLRFCTFLDYLMDSLRKQYTFWRGNPTGYSTSRNHRVQCAVFWTPFSSSIVTTLRSPENVLYELHHEETSNATVETCIFVIEFVNSAYIIGEVIKWSFWTVGLG